MRVEGPGQAAEIDLEEVGHVELVDQPVPVAVADRQPLDRLVFLLGLVELELEHVELDPLPPPLLRLGVGRGSRSVSGSSTIDSSTVKSGFCLRSSRTAASRSSARFR